MIMGAFMGCPQIKGGKMKIYVPTFEPIGHIYQDDHGDILKSVTTILKDELGLYQWKGTMTKATRGTNIHLACQFYDEKDLKEDSLTEDIKENLDQYKKALAENNIVVEANELPRYHPELGYAGTIDKIAKVDGKRAIIDIKTGKEEHWHCWQTAAYLGMIKKEIGDLARYCLYLTNNSYRLVAHQSDMDWAEWTILLAAHNIRARAGYLPKK